MNTPIILQTLESDNKYPYFFQNVNIDDNIYIVQRAFDIFNALFILDVWIYDKYNIGQIDRFINDDMPYTKYLYNSNNDIEKIDVNGGSDDYKILIYKKEGKLYVSCLLKFIQSK